MAESFYSGLNRFVPFRQRPGQRPFGMPDIDTESASQTLGSAMHAANEMKNQDLMRQKELMTFQNQMRNRGPIQVPRSKASIPASEKNYVLGPGSGTGKLPPSTVGADNAANDARAAAMNREFAAVNARREELAAGRTSAERIAGTSAAARLAESNRKGWSVANVQDPTNPTKVRTYRVNQATGDVEPLEFEGQNLGGVAKPGTKLPIMGDPKLQPGRAAANRALAAIKGLLDPENKETGLTAAGSAVSGKSRLGGLMEFYPGEARLGGSFVDNLKSNLLVNVLAELKTQSPTGASGFGNLSNQDRQALEKVVGRIDKGLSDEDFKNALIEVEGYLNKMQEDSPEERAAKAPAPTAAAPSAAIPPGRTKIRKNEAGVYVADTDTTAMDTTKNNARIQQSATDYLRSKNLPVTPANVEHAIKTGRVK